MRTTDRALVAGAGENLARRAPPPHGAGRVFTDRLHMTLSLAAGEQTFVFVAGSVEAASLRLRPWGFDASAELVVSSEDAEDELFAPFIADDPITATLEVMSCELDGTGEEARVAKCTGVVVERRVVEEVAEDVEGQPIVARRYRVRFCDPAAALWKVHHPIELYADASMQEVIEAHKAPGMNVTYEWTPLGEKREVLFISSGAEGRASFYDMVVWYVARHGGHLEHDAATGGYRFGGEKKRASSAQPLSKEAVASVRVVPPSLPRHAVRVRNSVADGASTVDVASPLAHTGVKQERLLRTLVPAHVDRRTALEGAMLREPLHAIELEMARCPPHLDVPGAFVELDEDFSKKLYTNKRTYRLLEVDLVAGPADVGEVPEDDDETRAYQVSMTMRLEQASSPAQHLPPHAAPRYPVEVEAKVLSAGGGEDDRTWQSAQGETDAITRYRVHVPLFNKKIVAPFEPRHVPGHFFFPLYKKQRVLLELYFDHAMIARHLDHAANARTPQDAQGNRLVQGLEAKNGTVVDHAYVDSLPVLTVGRTFGNDLQTITVKEGTIFIEVKEDTTQAALEPRYDVKVVVEAKKEEVAGEVQGAIGEVTASFEGAMGSTTATLDGAVEEVSGAVSAAEAKVMTKIEQIDAQLDEIGASLQATAAEITAAVADAKAALEAAVR